MNPVIFYSADKPVNAKNRQGIKKLIHRVFLLEGEKLKKIAFIFCSDEYLFKINKQHLNHSFYTDVIGFMVSMPKKPIESEVYISTERIKENAKIYKVPYQKELLKVMIHGALHFCGYKDKTLKAKKLMLLKEDFYIKIYEDSRET